LFTRKSGRTLPSEGPTVTATPPRIDVRTPKWVPAPSHLAAFETTRDIFAEVPEQILKGGWEELFAKLGSRLQNAGFGPPEARTVHRWIYVLQGYRLLGVGKGIGLVVPAAGLINFVEEQAVRRLLETYRPSAEEVASLLYGSPSVHVRELTDVIQRLAPPLVTGAAADQEKRAASPNGSGGGS
jgi:hypothetical protein